MNQYIVIFKTESQFPILSSNQEYEIIFGRYSLIFDVFLESLSAYYIFGSSSLSGVADLLRYNFQDITPREIDEFVHQFQIDHPETPLPVTYTGDCIPLIATDTNDMVLNIGIFKNPVYINKQQEMELLNIMKSLQCNKAELICQWFTQYCANYSIHAKLKRDQNVENYTLAATFCQVHGIGIQDLVLLPEKNTAFAWTLKDMIKMAGISWVILMVAFGIITWGSSVENFIISGLIMAIGFVVLLIPISYLINKK